MEPVTRWTGGDACQLQAALRSTNERFAEQLGIGVRTVASWHANPAIVPKPEMQQVLDTALERADTWERARFAQLRGGEHGASESAPEPISEAVYDRLASDPHIGSAMEWLDTAAGWPVGTARGVVASVLSTVSVRELQDRASRRAGVGQREIATVLADYYGAPPPGALRYTARVDYGHVVSTSIITRPEWLDVSCPIPGSGDALALRREPPSTAPFLDDESARRAARRLAETLTVGGRLVNRPLYRLTGVDVAAGRVGGTLGTSTFAAYALSLDLVEGELLDAVAADGPTRGLALPLRNRLLPDMASVLDPSGRLCAGGVLALCAIARPGGDYALLVQERSGAVLNASRTLAVIPKGFHQPIGRPREDTQIGRTLLREMEEELFGRDDVDNTLGDARRADPMHPTRLSEPMRWLTEHPEAWSVECTGFGFNLVSGNYEFPALIAITDEDFWNRYGGAIEANWESATLRQYSSADPEDLHELITEIGWSNEGLFALLQGLRRLARIDPNRVDCPAIEWEGA